MGRRSLAPERCLEGQGRVTLLIRLHRIGIGVLDDTPSDRIRISTGITRPLELLDRHSIER